jgi:hypothetical protein
MWESTFTAYPRGKFASAPPDMIPLTSQFFALSITTFQRIDGKQFIRLNHSLKSKHTSNLLSLKQSLDLLNIPQIAFNDFQSPITRKLRRLDNIRSDDPQLGKEVK